MLKVPSIHKKWWLSILRNLSSVNLLLYLKNTVSRGIESDNHKNNGLCYCVDVLASTSIFLSRLLSFHSIHTWNNVKNIRKNWIVNKKKTPELNREIQNDDHSLLMKLFMQIKQKLDMKFFVWPLKMDVKL